MTCSHQSRTRDRGQFRCGIKLYGGNPWLGNCQACIAKGQNTETYAQELFARTEKTHPSSQHKISGCCDSAKNYTDRI